MSTGLNFQTQTFINSNVDVDSAKKNGKGKDGKWLFRGANEADQVTVDGKKVDVFRVKRDFVFKKPNICKVRKAIAYEPIMTKASVDFNKIFDQLKPTGDAKRAYGRIDIYIGLEGSEAFLYANPWVRKGMPLWVEFTVTTSDTATTLADKLAKDIKKDKNFVIEHELIEVEAKSGKLTFTGADEYQRIRNVEVVTFNETEDYTDRVAKLGDDEAIKLDEKGENGFGTYSHVIRDLRLPTVENSYYSHIRQAETPILGALYNQFIVEYKDAASNDGYQSVGNRLDSYTTHVFWVNQAVSDEFEAELKKVYENEIEVREAKKASDEESASEGLGD